MFIITLTYQEPLEKVDVYLAEHRRYLDEGYHKNYLIASGPKVPRTGGIIISGLKDRLQLEAFLKLDPFYIHSIADYEITEFDPVKYHADFACFIQAH